MHDIKNIKLKRFNLQGLSENLKNHPAQTVFFLAMKKITVLVKVSKI